MKTPTDGSAGEGALVTLNGSLDIGDGDVDEARIDTDLLGDLPEVLNREAVRRVGTNRTRTLLELHSRSAEQFRLS